MFLQVVPPESAQQFTLQLWQLGFDVDKSLRGRVPSETGFMLAVRLKQWHTLTHAMAHTH